MLSRCRIAGLAASRIAERDSGSVTDNRDAPRSPRLGRELDGLATGIVSKPTADKSVAAF